MNAKDHWEKVYQTKQPNEVSWTQEVPKISLELIRSFNLPKSANIIDIGGGDSNLVDFLLDDGYEHISVLDISEASLARAKCRLGGLAEKVTWIVSDVTKFSPDATYDVWHDRATFHFLTTSEQIQAYIEIFKKSVTGHLVIGAFSDSGPTKCSGLEIHQYNEGQIEKLLTPDFEKLKCIRDDHKTPFGTLQNFLYCSFKRR